MASTWVSRKICGVANLKQYHLLSLGFSSGCLNFIDYSHISFSIYNTYTWLASILILLGFMQLSMFSPFRRRAFEIFYRFHWVGIILLIPLMILHKCVWQLPGVALWGIDVLVRFVWQALVRNKREANLVVLPGGVVRVSFPANGFKYRAGQHLFLCVPELSVFEWHPFSISSAPCGTAKDGLVTLHVRALGDWTRAFKELAGRKSVVHVRFQGPYGEPQVFARCSRLTVFSVLFAVFFYFF